MQCCTWALCETVHKEKVYVLRLKPTHTALVLKNAYIWAIRHFYRGDELERDWRQTTWSERTTSGSGPLMTVSAWAEPFHLRLDRKFGIMESTPS